MQSITPRYGIFWNSRRQEQHKKYVQFYIYTTFGSRSKAKIKINFLFLRIINATPHINLLNPTGHVMHQQFNIQQLYVLPTHCIYAFCIYLGTNSDLCQLQHKLVGFYNPDVKCLQRGTNWVFKYSSLRFVFKGLIRRFNVPLSHFLHSVCCWQGILDFADPVNVLCRSAVIQGFHKIVTGYWMSVT
jgi:hypothetical protein